MLGAIVVVVLTSLPVAGGVAKLLIVLFGLGALALAWWRSRKKDDDVDWSQVPAEPPAPTPTPPPRAEGPMNPAVHRRPMREDHQEE